MEFLFLFSGIALGIIITWLFFKLRSANSNNISNSDYENLTKQMEALTIENRIAEEKIKDNQDEILKLNHNIEKERNLTLDLNKKLSVAETDFRNLEERLQSERKELEQLNEKFNNQFKNLANEILEEKTQKFTEQNKTKLDEILKPLNDKIKEFEKKVEETYDKESKQRFSLQEEVKRLAELNQKISQEAHNLTTALKGQSKTQGNWGEVILERILEKSGLSRDREYFVQKSHTTEEGRRLQPDIVVTYPGERFIVIDSKVSLVAYERYVSAETEADKNSALKEHILSVKNHINELVGKNYQELYGVRSLDFTMMFLPIEPAYLCAIQNDPELWNYAYDRRVLLISPTNLIAALKMVASLWQQEYQNRNAQEIAEQCGALYDKFVGFVEDLIEVGKKIESSQTTYKNAMGKLYEGKGNLVKRVEEIKKLGAKAKKSLPQNLLDRADEGSNSLVQ